MSVCLQICDVVNDSDEDDAIKIAKYSIGVVSSLAYVARVVAMAGAILSVVLVGTKMQSLLHSLAGDNGKPAIPTPRLYGDFRGC